MSLSLLTTLFAVSSLILGAGLLTVRLLRDRAAPAVQNRVLRATLLATLAGLLLSVVPLPHPASPILIAPEITPPIRFATPTMPTTDAAIRVAPMADPAPPVRLVVLIPYLWTLISFALVLRLGFAYAAIVSLARRSTPYISETFPDGTVRTAGGKHTLRLLSRPESNALFMADLPLLRPFLMLPADAEARFAPEAFRAIIAHESAHRERRDCRWHLAAQTLCCLLWFQPLVWLLWRQLERTAEVVCDAAALSETACPPRAYAETLLQFAAIQRGFAGKDMTAPLIRSSLKERLETLMKHPSSFPLPDSARLRSGVALAAMILALGGASLFGVRTTLPANAQPPAATPASVVSDPLEQILDIFEVTNAKVTDIAMMALRSRGLRIIPAEWEEIGLTDSIQSLKMSEQPLRHALRLIIRASGKMPTNTQFNFHLEGNTVHLVALPLDASGLPRKNVTLRFGPGSLKEGLQAILKDTDYSVEVGDDLTQRVRFDFNNIPLAEAVSNVLNRYPGRPSLTISEGHLRVASQAQQAKHEEESRKFALMMEEKSREKWRQQMMNPVTLNLQNVPFRSAVEQLCKSGEITNYLIESTVNNNPVTLSFVDLPFESALKRLLAASKTPLSYKSENGVIIVSPAPAKQ